MNATMSPEEKKHYPVMLNQILSIITPQHGGTFIDCTFGGGGYSQAILEFPGTKVLAMDRDRLAQEHANILIKKFPKRFSFFREKFSNLNQVAQPNLNPKAVIFDLGLSSLQLADKKRGFSFDSKNFLNMEMGINEHSTYDVINTLDKEFLANIIKVLGDERDGKIIANKIVEKNLNPRAIIFDLGLSSFQLSDKERSFSFESKNFLNMEMGINKYSAYDVINTLDKEDLATIIKVLGEEKDGKKIANKIDKYRLKKPIKTSKELASIVSNAKKNNRNYKRNPATKTFQAIRIFVNQELTELVLGLIEAAKLLSNGGVLIVVSFHSLEDRIVKSFFNLCSSLKKNPSRYLPIKEYKPGLFRSISRKPLVADVKEIKQNIRSRSAKLRYAIRNNNTFLYPNDFKNKFVSYFKLEGGRI